MKKMPFVGYYPTFQVSSAEGKTILITTTRGNVLNVTKDEKRMQAGEKVMPLRSYGFSKRRNITKQKKQGHFEIAMR